MDFDFLLSILWQALAGGKKHFLFSCFYVFMSRRIDQVNALLQREIAEYVREHVEFPRGMMVTITRAVAAHDLKQARVFVSVLPYAPHADAMRVLAAARGEIQTALNGKLFMHHVPRIAFVLDSTEEEAAEVESLLDRI